MSNLSIELNEKTRNDQSPPFMVSVVSPAHNEEEGIAHTIDVISSILQANSLEYEIIVVDDGSNDLTYQEIYKISKRRKEVKGLLFSRNFGKESALLAGLKVSIGDAVVTIDADLQHSPILIPEMIKKWQKGAKIVHAVKRYRPYDNLFVRWRAAVFNIVLSKISGVDINNSTDYKLLDRSAVDIIVFELKERRRFYRGLSSWIGFEQAEILFDIEPRKDGHGKWTLFSLIDLATTATTSFTSAPLRIVTFLGFMTLFFAFAVSAEALWSRYRGMAVSGFATIEITILLIGSFIMISLGIIGEYIAKIYDELKDRPIFLISRSCGFNEDCHIAQGQRSHK